jgi:homocysteine S-methyltransferase
MLPVVALLISFTVMNIKYPLLIDGGLSNQLEEQGCDLKHSLWSANLLATNPEAIVQAHLAYLNAGAQCISTSSYQASVAGFMDMGYDRAESEAFILLSVELAEEAINRFTDPGSGGFRPLIAASIGPYGAYLADGSEYRGNYGVTRDVLRAYHLEKITLLDQSNADVFACETIPDFQEAGILAEILKTTQKLAWMSFSCKDERHLNDDTDIGECAAFLADHPNIFAIGVNCTDPKYISGLIKSVKANAGAKKIIVYPNSGEVYNAKTKTWMGLSNPASFIEMSKEWMDLGVDMIGGCCRIGPEHIKGLSNILTGD